MELDLKILPKRNGQTDGSFKNLQPIQFFTNYYDINLDIKKSKLHQYSFSLPEQIPQDSKVYDKAIRSIRKVLKEKIEYQAHTGQMIWGCGLLKVPTTFECKFEDDGTQHSLEGVVKHTKSLDLRDLDQQQTRQVYFQILNSNLKNMLKACKLNELGKRGQYFQTKFVQSQALLDRGLDVIKGYRFTLTQLNSGLFLQIDVSSRVLQSRNLLQTFNGQSKDAIKQKYTNSIVMTKYGSIRTYKIESIDFDKSPLSKFDKNGVQITFADYYKEAYSEKIYDLKQPLIKAIKSVKKQLVKGGKQFKQIKQTVYLVPELVCLTGMTDDQRANFDLMKNLAPYTKLSPTQRVKQCQKIIIQMNDLKDLIQIKNPKRLEGYILPRPNLTYSSANITPDNRGNIKHRGVLKQPFKFTDWMFIYSIGKNPDRDDQDADNAVGLLQKSGESYGVRFQKPGFLTIKSNNVSEWKNEIRKDVDKNGIPQIMVIYLTPYQQKFYGELKRFLTNEIKCPSQFIRKKTLSNPKGAMSAASKIAIQMNVKVGATPWQVQKRHPYFKNKNIMYGAISISKGKKGNILSFVGTTSNDCTKVYSDCKVGIKDKENIPVADLQQIFKNWAKTYFQTNNKKVPDLIILYRQGLSLPQIKMQIPNMEIPALEAMIQKIGANTGMKIYKPQYMIVTVNKKINNRYFAIGNQNRQNPNKFTPQLFNPDSGSIMVESMSTDNLYDFHLAAQYVTQGTCTPTLFRVAYDKTKMPQQALIHFTFEQCFNYYNWEGAVRVPACLQCADKLSKLVGQYVNENIVQSALSKKHFFL